MGKENENFCVQFTMGYIGPAYLLGCPGKYFL